MKRRLFVIFSCMSLLLFVAVCVLWVRSYWVHDAASCYRALSGRDTYDLWGMSAWSERARLLVACNWHGYPSHPPAMQKGWNVWWNAVPAPYVPFIDRATGRFGFDAAWATELSNGVSVSRGRICIPHWFAALMTALSTGLLARPAVQRFRLRHASRNALCTSCGYDLRATPGRCPECGAVPAKAGT